MNASPLLRPRPETACRAIEDCLAPPHIELADLVEGRLDVFPLRAEGSDEVVYRDRLLPVPIGHVLPEHSRQ